MHGRQQVIQNFKYKIYSKQTMPDNSYEDDRTPAQCRNGPIEQRSCTDCYCCFMYIILIAITLFFALFFSGAAKLTTQQITKELQSSTSGNPMVAILQTMGPILLTMAVVTAVSIILNLTTFLIPAIVGYIYVPLFLLLMLLFGVVFLVRYFGKAIPLVNIEIQQNFAGAHNYLTLIIGLVFIIAFIASLMTIFSKRAKFRNIVPVLGISKSFFWANPYAFICSIVLTMISVALLAVNIILLNTSQATDQSRMSKWIPAGIVILQIIWTHGIMEALSDFFFQALAIHWYFRQRRIQNNEERCCSTLIQTLRMVCLHSGTIIFGHILAYIPETLSTMLGRIEKKAPVIYNTFCLFHRCICRQMTKYGYIQTILQNQSFCEANRQMFGLRKRTKSILPELYMMGNFYITLAKIFLVMFSLVICYLLIAQMQPHVLAKPLNIIGPILITLLSTLEITNHFMNSTGLIGDTILFMYTVDLEIEKKNYGEMHTYSCPENILEIIEDIRKQQAVYDS